jgi:hypothetical protein
MAKSKLEPPSLELINSTLSYDPNSGVLTWKRRPLKFFKDARACNTWNAIYPGRVAGTLTRGYIRINVSLVFYDAHRLGWLIMYGEWPEEIDHINGIRTDNRIENLRKATRAQNCQNLSIRKSNTSGFIGASWNKKKKKWSSSIMVNYKNKFLGYYETAQDAHRAYLAGKIKYHTFNPIPTRSQTWQEAEYQSGE